MAKLNGSGSDWVDLHWIIIESISELLRLHGLEPQFRYDGQRLPCEDPDAIAATIDFNGATVRGSMVLRANPRTLRATYGAGDLDGPQDGPRIDVEDWLRELTNQASGRIKNRCRMQGLDFDVGVPSVTGGTSLPLEKLQRCRRLQLTCDTGAGMLELFLYVVTDEKRRLFRNPRGSVAQEGQLFIFDAIDLVGKK